MIKIGDLVYFIESFDEIHWYAGRFKPTRPKCPIKYKVIHIDKLNDGSLMYQTKHGHFHESWIDKKVFITESEARDNFKEHINYIDREIT